MSACTAWLITLHLVKAMQSRSCGDDWNDFRDAVTRGNWQRHEKERLDGAAVSINCLDSPGFDPWQSPAVKCAIFRERSVRKISEWKEIYLYSIPVVIFLTGRLILQFDNAINQQIPEEI